VPYEVLGAVTEAVPAAGDRVAAHCGSGRGVVNAARAGAGFTPFGNVATEVEHLMAAGLPAEAAVGAASWTVRAFPRPTGLTEGALADIHRPRRRPAPGARRTAASPPYRAARTGGPLTVRPFAGARHLHGG